MKILSFATLIISLLCILPLHAQNMHCGTHVTKEAKEYALEHLSTSRSAPVPRLFRKISITVHTVQRQDGSLVISQDQILAAVESLNQTMDTIKLSFEVCDFRTMENHNFAWLVREEEEDEMVALNYQLNTLNMYFVDSVHIGGQRAPGFTYMPGTGPDVMVLAGTGVMKHKIGHYLGLFHTNETSMGLEFVDLSNCETAGDLICDTDADPYFPTIEYDPFTCNLTETLVDPNGDLFVPPMDNIMSAYGPCQCRFSRGQYQRMAEQFLLGRTYLW